MIALSFLFLHVQSDCDSNIKKEADETCATEIEHSNDIYAAKFEINHNKNELQLEVRNKNTKHLFIGTYTTSQLIENGFAPQHSLNDIKTLLEASFNAKEESLSLTIS